ncbi:hypothetical protein [Nitrospira sp. Kam-Ns4a]
MPREMLCYCLNLTYEDVRRLWARGYFDRDSDRHPGRYCTSCKADLAWFLGGLATERRPAGKDRKSC